MAEKWICALAAAGAMSSANAAAAAVRSLPFEFLVDQAQLAFVGDGGRAAFDAAPDGSVVAYVLRSRAENRGPDSGRHWDDKGVRQMVQNDCTLYVLDLTSRRTTRISAAEGSDWAPAWSPDGRLLAFYSSRGDAVQLWIWNREDRAVRRVLAAPMHPFGLDERPIWTPDSTQLVVKMLPRDEQPGDLNRVVAVPLTPASERGPTVSVYRSPRSTSEAGALDSTADLLADIGVVRVDTGEATRLVERQLVSSLRVLGDAPIVSFTSYRGRMAEGSEAVGYELQVATSGSTPRRLAANLEGAPYAVSTDGRRWAYFASTPAGESARPGETTSGGARGLYLADLKATTPRKLNSGIAGDPPESLAGSLEWAATGNALYASTKHALWEIDADSGRWRQVVELSEATILGFSLLEKCGALLFGRNDQTLTLDVHKVDLCAGKVVGARQTARAFGAGGLPSQNGQLVHGGRKFIAILQEAARPPDLWSLDRASLQWRQVSRLNPQLDEFMLGESRLLSYCDALGHELRAALLLPAGYERGRRYPLVVAAYPDASLHADVHEFGLRTDFFGNAQLAATRGYASLIVDAPLSGAGTMMEDMARSILAGTDEAIRIGVADPDRLALIGFSGGAYAVLATLVQTKRFKAAVEVAGVSNLFSHYGTFVTGGSEHYAIAMYEERWPIGGTPWTARERYIASSPWFFLDRIETPLLMIHGTEDQSVPVHLADETFAALRRLGKVAEYARYSGEGHALHQSGNIVDSAKRSFEFLQRHLRARATHD